MAMSVRRLHLAQAALLAVAGLAAAGLAGCASTKGASAAGGPVAALPPSVAALGDSFGAGNMSAFAEGNLASISAFSLPNGIPVVLRRSSANRVLALSLVIRGGAAAAAPGKAGLESLALATMARGSAKYPYEEIQALLDETSSSLGRSSSLDFSSYSLVTLDKYLDRLLPLWADTLARPLLAPEDFEQCLSEAKLALQAKAQDPWASTAFAVNEVFFEGHPYAAAPEGTGDSLERATLEAVRDWYASSFSADRMFIVAVGDFDPEALREKLEAGGLGSIPDRKLGPVPRPPAFAPGGALGSLDKREFPQSRGVAYLRGDFAAPGPEDPDYMPLNIGLQMFSDLLLNVVRDEHGAVYTPSAYIRDNLANYGSIVMYKTKVAGRIKSYIDEAADDLFAGRVLSTDPEASGGAKPRASVAAALASYKATYVNALFEGQATNAGVAARIAKSIVASGDCRSWLLDFDRIEAVTADQVRAALAKYLAKGRIRWVVLGSQDAILPAVDVDFEYLGSAP